MFELSDGCKRIKGVSQGTPDVVSPREARSFRSQARNVSYLVGSGVWMWWLGDRTWEFTKHHRQGPAYAICGASSDTPMVIVQPPR
jgi:hypothetical protein